jgi:hypothetical protein
MDKITVGRDVHYVLPGGVHRPAKVVNVWPIEEEWDIPAVNLQVFTDGPNDVSALQISGSHVGTVWRACVLYSEEKQQGTWHWPERV